MKMEGDVFKKQAAVTLKTLVVLREKMGRGLSVELVKRFFGQNFLESCCKGLKISGNQIFRQGSVFKGGGENIHIRDRKIKYLKSKVDLLIIPGLTKFIGVSGSIAAGTVKENDDIDLFIVVRNFSSWIYRFLVTLRLRRRGIVMHHGSSDSGAGEPGAESQKDKFCLNFIVEERGLTLEPSLINLHELLHLIIIWSHGFVGSDCCSSGNFKKGFNEILMKNQWINEQFGLNLNSLNEGEYRKEKMCSRRLKAEIITDVFGLLILFPANAVFFVFQGILMLLHGGNIRQIIKWWITGRIAIYENSPNYKSEV